MPDNDFSYGQCNAMIPGEEVGTFFEQIFNSDKVSSLNEMYEKSNMQVIRWLKEHGAPEELISMAMDAEAQGSNVMLAVLDEIRLSGELYYVVPESSLQVHLAEVGPRAAAMYRSLKDGEYVANKKPDEGKDYRES